MSSLPNLPVPFGARLKHLLSERNILQVRLAEELGITRARLNNYIAGRSEPDYATLAAISRNLQVSTDFLLGLQGAEGMEGCQIDGDIFDTGGSAASFPEFVPGPEVPPCSEPRFEWVPLYTARPQLVPIAPQIEGWLRVKAHRLTPAGFRQSFALRIQDESLAPEMLVSDIVYIQPVIFSYFFLSSCGLTDLFAVRLHPADTVGVSLKHCYVRDNTLICFSDNNAFEPVILDMQRTLHVPLVGRISGVWRSYQGRGVNQA